ncbi:MAG: hypothetical protein RRB13_10810 [bacterium]|nr:hypothetical protein [bacterium]
MGEILSGLPAPIQTHIKSIARSAGLPDSEESYEKLAQGWAEKLRLFEEKTAAEGMVEVEQLGKDDAKGCVALTYSGSLVLIGPLDDGVRKCVYNSIGIRKDVPDSVAKEDSLLASDVAQGQPVEFAEGPVKSTSAIYKIAVAQEALTVVQEQEKISEVTVILTEGFVDVNKALVPVG